MELKAQQDLVTKSALVTLLQLSIHATTQNTVE